MEPLHGTEKGREIEQKPRSNNARERGGRRMTAGILFVNLEQRQMDCETSQVMASI